MMETLINIRSYYKFVTANNNKNNSAPPSAAPPKQEGTFKEIETAQVPQNDSNQQGQEQVPDLNDVIQDLKTLSNLCSQKLIEYADLTGTFKQIGQITNNLALGLSVYLQDKGELDSKRFKLVK